jgi:hypothetical protein
MIDRSKRGELASGEDDSSDGIHWKNHGLDGDHGRPPSLVDGAPIEASGAERDTRAKVLAAGNVDRLDCPFSWRVSGLGL